MDTTTSKAAARARKRDAIGFFSDPLDPQRSLQLNNRYWPGDRFTHLDALREADDDITYGRYRRLRRSLRPIKALLPAQYHRALIARLAYSIVYRIQFEPIRFTIPLSDAFLDANRYRGAENEAYMDGQRLEELRHVVGLAHEIYRDYYGGDALYSGFQVRYANSTNERRVHESTGFGEFSDYHLDQRADFTCIIYLSEVRGRENGCFSYLDGTSLIPKSHLLRALHGVVSFEMELATPDLVGGLPLELRGGIGMGNFLDDAKHARLAATRTDFVGDVGDGIIFNGFDTLHRGGKPLSGERLAIFVSTAGRFRMRARRYARQLFTSLWA